jgi:hypothetical protein
MASPVVWFGSGRGYRLATDSVRECPVRSRAPAISGRLSHRVRPCRLPLRFCKPEVTGSIPVRSIAQPSR